MTQAIEPISIQDLNGKTHEFRLTAAALRRVMRRMAKVNAEHVGGDLADRLLANRIEQVYVTAWESRVDKSATEEEQYFELFTPDALRKLVEQLSSDQGQEPDPTKATPTAPPTEDVIF